MTRFEDLDLFRWWDPMKLAQAVGRTFRLDDGKIVAEQRFQKHLEAWIVSHFGVGYSQTHGIPVKVKLVPERERTPDAVLRIHRGDSVRSIGVEITTVLTPGRRLREEYRQRVSGVMLGSRPVRIPEPKEVAAWIKYGLRAKASCADLMEWLLIYLNPDWYDGSGFVDHIDPRHLAGWAEVHVLSSGGLAFLTLKGDGPREWTRFDLKEKGC